ncbi:hypothetical protein BGZ83_005632 [Gryganskiella cystojenkinii]|nr:hypothetical protein BGZ83_005632 [Gryganskiella cystojenkinii]
MSSPVKFTEREIADFKESFEAFDRNQDGTISRRELHSLLHTVGHKVNAHGLEDLLAEHDVDQSGTIDFDEFVTLASRLMKFKLNNTSSPATFSPEEIACFKESFVAFDRNGDGNINASELRSLLKIVGEKVHATSVADALDEFDTNGDKHIDFNEFLNLASKYIKNKTPTL